MFLTRDELITLTGYRRCADQLRWLDRNRVPHVVNAAGRPVVARAAAEVILGVPGHRPAGAPEPNWGALGA